MSPKWPHFLEYKTPVLGLTDLSSCFPLPFSKGKLFPRTWELLVYSCNLHTPNSLKTVICINSTRKYSPTSGESIDIKSQGLLHNWFSCIDHLLELICSQMLSSSFLTLHLNQESDKRRKFLKYRWYILMSFWKSSHFLHSLWFIHTQRCALKPLVHSSAAE